jgi:galactonate dehydratase
VALCAALPNFDILEYQWGEQPWRSNLVAPSENFVNGTIEINDSPGFGIVLNEQVLAEHRS